MKTENNIKVSNILNGIARYSLLIIGICVFAFALVSGSEEYGGGIRGIVKNSPNALPWLLLLFLTFISWKWKLIGGILITLLGMTMMYFFHVFTHFNGIVFSLTFLITMCGGFLIGSWYLRKVN